MLQSVILNYSVCHYTAVFYIVVKLLDLDPQGLLFGPWCGHSKICTAVGPLSKALNPTLLQGGDVYCLVKSTVSLFG